jgi:hypothetical protein
MVQRGERGRWSVWLSSVSKYAVGIDRICTYSADPRGVIEGVQAGVLMSMIINLPVRAIVAGAVPGVSLICTGEIGPLCYALLAEVCRS